MIPNLRPLECEYGIRVKESAKSDCRFGLVVENRSKKHIPDVSDVSDVSDVTDVTDVTSGRYERYGSYGSYMPYITVNAKFNQKFESAISFA